MSKMDLESVRRRFVQVKQDLGAVYREREAAIECIVLAALSRQHALLVGPPGTGKSALFFGFLSSFTDAKKFQTLLTRFTTEDELFGPVKLSALKADRWERALDGRLAGVECAFLDETFKGSDSVLNALLSAMNERLYKGAPIPLRLLVGASNELPEEEILAAVYDRFLLRDVVEYVEADATWLGLLASPPAYTASVAITVAEWEAACQACETVVLPERVCAEMLRIKTALKADGLIVSDRRWIALTRVLRAAAWLDGETEVSLDHLAVLRYGLWQKPDDRGRVNAILATVDRGVVARATEIIDTALTAYAKRPTDAAGFRSALPSLADTLKDAAKGVQALLKGGVSRRAAERVNAKLEELKAAHGAVQRALRVQYIEETV